MTLQCLLVTPPFSPNTSNPLLGPAILKSHAEAAGFELRAIDLNILYISMFAEEADPDRGNVVGDHNADERQIDRAREYFTQSLYLPDITSERIPCCDDPNSSLPHSFEEIDASLKEMKRDGFWPNFLATNVFSNGQAPAVLGISIMGPAQVPLALLLASLCKQHWPETIVIAGGSHITLLARRIAEEPRYSGSIDFFAPGHSEDVLIEVMERLDRQSGAADLQQLKGLLRAGHGWTRNQGVPPEQRLAPIFEESELAYYQKKGLLTLPIQLARGCAYGRCTYCTYPVVEEFERTEVDRMAERFLPPMLRLSPHFISVKDSLLTMASMDTFGQAINAMKPDLGWSATTKVHVSMTPQRMRELYGMGCRTLEMGIETIHPHSQKFFDKVEPLTNIEAALEATLEAGISVVINMIYGIPGESIEDAHKQMTWWRSWHDRHPGKVFGVHNMLQIDEGSPLSHYPERYGLSLRGTGPWSFTYVWNAPEWRPHFERYIRENGGRAQ